MYQITLNAEDVGRAIACGTMRGISSMKKKLENTDGLNPNRIFWQYHIEGAAAELATSRVLGVEWGEHVDVFHRKPDIGNDRAGFEVRVCMSREFDDFRAKITRRDTNAWPHIFCWGWLPTFTVVGWYRKEWCYDRSDLWQSYGGDRAKHFAWWIPADELKPLHELPAFVDKVLPAHVNAH